MVEFAYHSFNLKLFNKRENGKVLLTSDGSVLIPKMLGIRSSAARWTANSAVAELAILPKQIKEKRVKKALLALFVLVTIAALAIASSASASGGGGLDAWFMVDPGCVVEITPYADYGNGRLGARTFDRPAVIVIDKLTGQAKYEPARMQLNGGVYYDVTFWCPGIAPTSQGTLYVPGWAFGDAKFWLPLHNQVLGKCGPWAVYDALP